MFVSFNESDWRVVAGRSRSLVNIYKDNPVNIQLVGTYEVGRGNVVSFVGIRSIEENAEIQRLLGSCVRRSAVGLK